MRDMQTTESHKDMSEQITSAADTIVRAKMTLRCGRLHRGRIRRYIIGSVPLGVDLDMQEDFGLLDGIFVIRAAGEGVWPWLRDVQTWVEADTASRA